MLLLLIFLVFFLLPRTSVVTQLGRTSVLLSTVCRCWCV